MRNCTVNGVETLLYLKMRTDTPQRYSNILVENVTGSCATFFRVNAWSQYENLEGRTKEELKSFATNVILRNNVITCRKVREGSGEGEYFELTDLVMENNTFSFFHHTANFGRLRRSLSVPFLRLRRRLDVSTERTKSLNGENTASPLSRFVLSVETFCCRP